MPGLFNPSQNLTDSSYQTFWGVHVHSFAFYVSVIEIILGFTCFLAFVTKKDKIRWLLWTGVLSLVSGFLLFIGNREMIWCFYIPEIITRFMSLSTLAEVIPNSIASKIPYFAKKLPISKQLNNKEYTDVEAASKQKRSDRLIIYELLCFIHCNT
ncbi:hypothetical protein M3Y97_00944200 [Aphelenchoides bicaudatus]|nr:hypothetical protein M3Y97_00944200 [Aphelenchoides bicaudatus]